MKGCVSINIFFIFDLYGCLAFYYFIKSLIETCFNGRDIVKESCLQ